MGNDSKQVYETKYYNLDVIISVGYRVNSKYNCGPSARTAATHRENPGEHGGAVKRSFFDEE